MQQKTTPYIRQGWLRALLFFIILVNANSVIYYQIAQLPDSTKEETFSFLPALTMTQGILTVTALLSVFLVLVFCKLIDKAPLRQLGLQKDVRGALTGFFLSAALLGTGSMILFFSGDLQWVNVNNDQTRLITALVLMLLVAFSEELAFRGYILANLLQSFPKWPAILLSAAAFVIMHAANPGMQVTAIINLFLGGILLGQCFMICRNCWMPVLFHFGWNFLQGPLLGFTVSGLKINSLLEQQVSKNELMTGGAFGFEGSLVATCVLIAGVILMEFYFSEY